MSIDIYILQIFLSPKKSRDEKFQNKKEIQNKQRKCRTTTNNQKEKRKQ